MELKGETANPWANLPGTRIEEVTPGYARIASAAGDSSGYGFAAGRLLLALAEAAFSCGADSLDTPSRAAQFHINFIGPVPAGEELVAECRVVRNGRRLKVWEIRVTTREGLLLASATGTTVPDPQARDSLTGTS